MLVPSDLLCSTVSLWVFIETNTHLIAMRKKYSGQNLVEICYVIN